MNINDTPEEAAFRAEVREWIDKEIPPHLKGLRQEVVMAPEHTNDDFVPIWEALGRKPGWLAPAWPEEVGGAGWNAMQMIIYEEEYTRAGIPQNRNMAGIGNLGPILIKYGTPEQKAKYLGPTMRRDIYWCQGYSEPNAGSDLASLQLRADPTEGGWLLNGQKIWTSRAHFAEMMFLLARTDPTAKKKQEGISFFILDMKTPGITVRPLLTIDDHHHFNETFFENVFVPTEGLVGELNKGWTVAKALLGYERFNSVMANPLVHRRATAQIKEAARERSGGNGGVLWDDVALRRRVAEFEMAGDALAYTRYRGLTAMARGQQPGPETQVFKFFGTELFKQVIELHQLVLGPEGIAWEDEPFGHETKVVARHAANIRASSIRGGTTEVQKNVLAKRTLGLPG